MKKTFFILIVVILQAACTGPQKSVSANPELESGAQNTPADKAMLQEGVDFFATGNAPSNWQLEMNYDDTVSFSADDGLALKVAYNQLKKNNTAARSDFSGNLPAGKIDIVMTNGSCTVTTIRKVFQKTVMVTFNGKTYSGCGGFLADNTLNGKWTLEKTGADFIEPGDFNQVPYIEFDLLKQHVSGNDGCNAFGGNIEVQGSRIKFSALISTKMACMKKSIEATVGNNISHKFVDYFFKGGKLYLYLPDDSMLVFVKL